MLERHDECCTRSCFSESSKYLTEKLRLVNFLESDKEKMIDFGEIYSGDRKQE